MPVSKRLRYEILRRDNHTCRYCGAAAPDVKLNVDHVIPQALGGTDKPDNLLTACAACNAGKTSTLPNATCVKDVNQDAFRRAASRRREATALRLELIWVQAYEQTGRTPRAQERAFFMELTRRVLACGLPGRIDLTEPARRAGFDNAIDIQSYIRPSLPQLTQDETRFLNNVVAVDVWDAEWDFVTHVGGPTSDQVDAFIDAVGAALDEGQAPTLVVEAARLAGHAMSLDLPAYLSQVGALGGAI